MSEKLPATRTGTAPDRINSNGHSGRLSGLSEWIGSPVGRAVAQALPDLLRMTNRAQPPEPRSYVPQILPSSEGASGITLSEVDLDLNIPFIRRLTIRRASTWSIAPDMILASQRNRSRTGWKLRALVAGAIGVAGVVLAHRNGLSLPERLNPATSLPLRSPASARNSPVEQNPGAAE